MGGVNLLNEHPLLSFITLQLLVKEGEKEREKEGEKEEKEEKEGEKKGEEKGSGVWSDVFLTILRVGVCGNSLVSLVRYSIEDEFSMRFVCA